MNDLKVLYLSSAQGPDYQCDMVFHGLRAILGSNVVDVNKLDYMYKSYSESHDLSTIYGRGFTMYGLLPDLIDVDREDIKNKISSHYYDLVIYGSIHRSHIFILDVLASYKENEIIFIDGEDLSELIVKQLIGRGIYFKREYAPPKSSILPIQFAIPYEKLIKNEVQKSKVMAYIDPRDRNTYIYSDEASYYADYASSLFAVTTKKGGWDCLRHYEILANNCVPFFIGLKDCPVDTMHKFPKYEIMLANNILVSKGQDFFNLSEGMQAWFELNIQLQNYVKRHMTTENLAKYVIDTWVKFSS
jgi:hypothetical protein